MRSRVALTFDAEHPSRPGGRPGNARRILHALRDEEVRATFFVQGRWASAYPDIAARIVDDGHVVGHHSHHHAPMTLLTDEGIAADLAAGREAILRATGTDPFPWLRLPFGDGYDYPRVLGVLAGLGYRHVHWTVELEDWEPSRTGEAIVDDALAAVRASPSAIVLLHTWPDGTADAVRPLIRGLRDQDARFVTVDELERPP